VRTILFGLDGATFTVLDHMMAEGIMPNLKAFCQTGVRAKLRSTTLPMTPQAWTSMATGRGMGHHGINDFVRIEIRDDSVYAKYNTSTDIKCDTIWKYASRNDRRVTVLNYIGLAPPEPINGHSIPGFVPSRHLRRSSFPADLFNRLKEAEKFNIRLMGLELDFEKKALSQMPDEQWLPWIEHHIAREEAWFGTLEHLMINEPSDLTAIVFDGVDKIQHLAYRFLGPECLPADPTPWQSEVMQRCRDYFQQVDGYLGRTRELLGEEGRIFIASDHGFSASTEIFYVNKFLHDEGLLVWKEQPKGDENETIFVDKLQNHLDLIDIKRTKAFALTPSSNGIFINVPPEEYDEFRGQLIDKLFQIKGPDGGQVVTEAKTREEGFPGPYENHAPDLTLTLRDFGVISVLNASDVVIPRSQPWGTHHPDGVLMASGPGLRSGVEVERRDIVEVTSLLAHSLSLAIPADYEGEFPESFYEADYLADDPPRIGDSAECPISQDADGGDDSGEEFSEEDEAIVLQRLRSLGYIE